MSPALILVAEYASPSRKLLAAMLEATGHQVLVARDGGEALALATQKRPDLVLADIQMPGLNGYELCSRLRLEKETREIPVVLLGAGEPTERLLAYQVGADDYLAKPVSRLEVAVRVGSHLRAKELLGEKVEAEAVMEALAQAVEAREPYTQGHARRCLRYCLGLAEAAGLSHQETRELRRGALLHDVGKLAIPERILLKPGPLEEGEWAEVRLHPVVGARICSPLGRLAAEVVRHHHERWDGGGYPDGLKGEETPLLARLMAVADAYDALTSPRLYRPAFSPEQARQELLRGMGTQLDPRLAALFLELLEAP